MKTYKDLIVWQKAITLTVLIYKVTKNFPPDERYGLTSQMRRAAASIPANIAEGKLRGSVNEFRHFLHIAFGSGGELETHIEIAKQLEETKDLDYTVVQALLDEVMRMLNVMINRAELGPKA